MLVVKGKSAAQQGVEDDPTRPDVDLGPGVELARDDLRRGVVWRAATRPQELSVCHHVGQAKVSYLDVLLLVQQQVLGLQVAVDHIVPANED